MTRMLRLSEDEFAARAKRREPQLEPSERDVLAAVLTYLRYAPQVAFAWRANAGVFIVGDEGKQRRVRAGFAGQSDILGMLKSGRFLAVEVKRPGGQLTTDQHAFLSRVDRHGGLALVVRSVDELAKALEAA